MRSRTTVRPVDGTTAQTNFLQQVVDQIFGQLQFYDSPTVKFQKTGRGIRARVIVPPTASKAAAAKSDFAGVYVNGASYDSFEWVVIQSGPGNGAYISTADGNSNDPRTGINWIQFSALTQWF